MVDAVMCILVADDEMLIALAVQQSLEDEGYLVEVASSGAEALSALRRSDLRIAGLITDIRMGTGPDGWEVAMRARHMIPALPVVYMSGDSAHEHIARGVPDSLMIQKPFSNVCLVRAVAPLLQALSSR